MDFLESRQMNDTSARLTVSRAIILIHEKFTAGDKNLGKRRGASQKRTVKWNKIARQSKIHMVIEKQLVLDININSDRAHDTQIVVARLAAGIE